MQNFRLITHPYAKPSLSPEILSSKVTQINLRDVLMKFAIESVKRVIYCDPSFEKTESRLKSRLLSCFVSLIKRDEFLQELHFERVIGSGPGSVIIKAGIYAIKFVTGCNCYDMEEVSKVRGYQRHLRLDCLMSCDLPICQYLQRHRAIRDVDEVSSLSYLVTQHANYGDLFDFMYKPEDDGHRVGYRKHSHESQSFLPSIPVVKRLFKQIAFALSIMHTAGYAHMDLKAENILLYQDPTRHRTGIRINGRCDGDCLTAKLTDFGHVLKNKKAGGLVGPMTYYYGTAWHAPPELWSNHRLMQTKNVDVKQLPNYDSFAADVWALGYLLRFLILGKDIETMQMEDNNFRDLYISNPSSVKIDMITPSLKELDLDGSLSQILNHTIRKEVGARYGAGTIYNMVKDW